jgi:hypothetical protein
MDIEKINAFFDSPEGQKSLEKFADKLKREQEHKDRWTDRMWERIQSDLDGSIDHMLKWYNSDPYRDREYRKGYQPREELLWVLFGVAEAHGEECTDEEVDLYANTFTRSIYKLGSYAIQIMDGQGSIIAIDKIK